MGHNRKYTVKTPTGKVVTEYGKDARVAAINAASKAGRGLGDYWVTEDDGKTWELYRITRGTHSVTAELVGG